VNASRQAAARDFQIIQTLDHQNLPPVLDYKEHEIGSALLFRYVHPNAAVRFDQFLTPHGDKLERRLAQLVSRDRYDNGKGCLRSICQ
jgi:hypothetical protein